MLAESFPTRYVMDLLDLSRVQVNYWKRKVAEPSFHPSSHGGARNWALGENEHRRTCALLWQAIQDHPDYTINDYGEYLRQHGARICSQSQKLLMFSDL